VSIGIAGIELLEYNAEIIGRREDSNSTKKKPQEKKGPTFGSKKKRQDDDEDDAKSLLALLKSREGVSLSYKEGKKKENQPDIHLPEEKMKKSIVLKKE